MKKITFAIPKGFQPPEGITEGDEFSAAATLKLEDGKLCLVAVDDVPLKGYEEESDKGRKANEGGSAEGSNMASRYQAAMQQMAAANPQGMQP